MSVILTDESKNQRNDNEAAFSVGESRPAPRRLVVDPVLDAAPKPSAQPTLRAIQSPVHPVGLSRRLRFAYWFLAGALMAALALFIMPMQDGSPSVPVPPPPAGTTTVVTHSPPSAPAWMPSVASESACGPLPWAQSFLIPGC